MKTKRPLFYITIVLMLGIVLSQWRFMPIGVVILTLLPCLLVLFFMHNKEVSVLLTLLMCLLMGYFMGMNADQWPQNHVGHIARYVYGKEITIRGRIISDPQHRQSGYGEKTMFALQVMQYHAQSIDGRVLVNAFGRRDLSYGDHIQLTGKLHRPFEYDDAGNFSYRRFLEYQQIYHIFSVKKKNAITVIKDGSWSLMKISAQWQHQLSEIIDTYLSPKEAGLINAMILGKRTEIPNHIRLLFERTGTAHILAISGIHISVIVFLLMLSVGFLPLPRWAKYVLVIVLLIGYVFMTGCRVSVIRASIMVGCLYVALITERESDSLNALGFAALVILTINPLAVFQLGFQLSFLSVVSILVILPQTDRWLLTWTGWGKRLGQSMSVSVAAWLGTLGVVVYYFGIITPVAIIANVIIVPLMSMVVVLSFGLLFCSAISLLAQCFALCLKVVLNTMAACAYVFSHFPGAYFMMDVGWRSVVIYYIILITVILVINRRGFQRLKIDKKQQLC